VISGRTIFVPLIGHPVAQVFTPPVVNDWFANHGIDAVMVPLDVLPDRAAGFFQELRFWENAGGCSVTVPHKRTAFLAMDEVTERAGQVQAVNIVRRTSDGRLLGDMTDGLAFVAALRANAVQLAGSRVLLVGAGGGAGAAIAMAIAGEQPAELTLFENDNGRREAIARALRQACPMLRLSDELGNSGYDLVVNATPLGMRGDDPLPADVHWLRPGGTAADVVTRPAETPFLLAARDAGMGIQTGADMARAQLPFQMQHLDLSAASAPASEQVQ
tara:strand:+ start:64193 stop:65014 length:822 start_codon:yes stop_codon:yes gene_type:complete